MTYVHGDAPIIQSSVISKLRILLRFSVAMAVSLSPKKPSPEPAVGVEGADLACTSTSTCSGLSAGGNSSDTLRFWWSENLGIGSELGGGELEYAGPAQSSGREGGDPDGVIGIALLRFLPLCSCCLGVLGSGE